MTLVKVTGPMRMMRLPYRAAAVGAAVVADSKVRVIRKRTEKGW
jgi:hypothetical protein